MAMRMMAVLCWSHRTRCAATASDALLSSQSLSSSVSAASHLSPSRVASFLSRVESPRISFLSRVQPRRSSAECARAASLSCSVSALASRRSQPSR
eukprot:3235522-Rhodomonas_salina.1